MNYLNKTIIKSYPTYPIPCLCLVFVTKCILILVLSFTGISHKYSRLDKYMKLKSLVSFSVQCRSGYWYMSYYRNGMPNNRRKPSHYCRGKYCKYWPGLKKYFSSSSLSSWSWSWLWSSSSSSLCLNCYMYNWNAVTFVWFVLSQLIKASNCWTL